MGQEEDRNPLMGGYQQAAPQPHPQAQGGYVTYQQPMANYAYLQPGQQPPQGQVVYVVQGGPSPIAQPYQVPLQPPPGVVYVQRPYPSSPYNGMALTSFICFMLTVAMGFWPLQIISIAISLHMVHMGVIPCSQKGTVIALSIFEILGWAFLPSFVWFYTCTPAYNYGAYYSCWNVQWWGWISIVVWYATALAFGIARVVLTYKARRNQATPSQCHHGC